MLHVVFARPHQLHRLPSSFRNLPRLRRIIPLIPPPEAAARPLIVNRDRLGREAGIACHLFLDRSRALRPRPYVDPVRAHIGRAVHRLHRRVRLKRKLVNRFHHLRRLRQPLLDVPPLLMYIRRRTFQLLLPQFAQRLRRFPRIPPAIPRHRQRFAAFDRRPRIVRDHRYSARCIRHAPHRRDFEHLPHSRNALRRRSSVLRWLPAERRTSRHHRIQHPRNPHVHPVLRAAIHLRRNIPPRHRVSDQPVVL